MPKIKLMENTRWILLDTETTGLTAPIFVVELAAQWMCGWNPEGPSFRRLINQNAHIPSEVSRVHGYTPEILERDGEPPQTVYRDFAAYVGDLPLVSFNLQYDLEQVLEPEWARLGILSMSNPGFCALRLTQRLLDPVPAGNCKLQTLRQYYRLPERGAHTALGDVQTVADLFAAVLQPIAQHRHLLSWNQICAYAQETWFPSRIAFGKYKGRHYQEARTDAQLLGWLEWLARSTNERSATMGRWYLNQLATAPETVDTLNVADFAIEDLAESSVTTTTEIICFVHLELEKLKRLIGAARTRLADLEATYTQERHAVDVTQSQLFGLLRPHYQRRDRLKLVVDYRRRFLDVLLRSGEEEAQQVEETYQEAQQQNDAEYEQAAAQAANQRELSDEEQHELKTLWRKLVRLYHPDRFAHDLHKLEAFQKLTTEINRARDEGDVEQLREIANDPHGFMLRQGWENLDFRDSDKVAHLQKLLDTLQLKIVSTLDALNELRESPEHELHKLSLVRSDYLQEVAKDYIAKIMDEIKKLDKQAATLADEIEELTGSPTFGEAKK